MDARVEAIRKHRLVGRGSCTSIDECFSDAELLAFLDENEVKTPEQAVAWAIDFEDLKMEQALNARWGEDGDSQKVEYDEWRAKRKESE
jgi:hypothetical protein